MFFTVHFDDEGGFEVDKSQERRFVNGGLRLEEGIVETIAFGGADREVADAVGGEVLEKMGTLAWVDVEVGEAVFGNHPCI